MCHKLQPQLHWAPLSCKDNSPTAGERSMRAEAQVCEGLHAAKYYQKAPKRISWISIWFSLVWMEITSGSILMITQFKILKRPFRRLLNVHLFLCSTWETSVSGTSQFLSIILWKLNWHWQRSLVRFCGAFVRNYFDVLFFFCSYLRTRQCSHCCCMVYFAYLQNHDQNHGKFSSKSRPAVKRWVKSICFRFLLLIKHSCNCCSKPT